MNNLYINPNNQKILWNAINTNPYFRQLTSPDKFFKSIINIFYEKNKWVNDQYTLEKLNRETIQYMINVLKGKGMSNLQTENTHVGYQPREQEMEKRENVLFSEFNKRLQSYNTDKPPPPPLPETIIETIDKPINNMEELIQHQMKLREQDMTYLPVQQNQTIEKSQSNIVSNNSIEQILNILMELKEQLKGLETRILQIEKPIEKENIEYTIEEKTI
jgi:hypothetical protein